MKVTIWADNLDDFDRARRILLRDIEQYPDRSKMQDKRNGHLYSSLLRNDSWRALVWGGPDHYRVDCRSATDE